MSFEFGVNRPFHGSLRGRAAGDIRALADILRDRASARPDDLVFDFVTDDGSPEPRRTFGELDRRARAIAARFVAEGLVGSRVLLLYPAGLEFVDAFFACLASGVVAVPVPVPRAARSLDRLAAVAADCAPRAALCPAALLDRTRSLAAARAVLAGLAWIATDAVDDGEAELFESRSLDPSSLAYLQYTSGSTAEPKGVMISHANLAANSEDIARGFAHSSGSRSLSWLPHFHDMGLVDGVVQPVYSGFRATLMAPATFLRRPSRWLEAISDRRVTHSGAPNFAYDLCARRVEADPSRLDLSSWRVAYDGAEPVRAETLDRFAERFADCGFDRTAITPAYGLAEATLKVTGGAHSDGPRVLRVDRAALERGSVEPAPAGVALVGSGRAGDETRVAIVDPETGDVVAGCGVGEIFVAGPGVALGYWNRSDATERTFGARVAGDDARYLRTGDLGFVRDGELFVTGRAKDLVIVRGRNLYPQDVERAAEVAHAAVRIGGGAAFGVEIDGEERLVVVSEIDRRPGVEPAELLAAIRGAVVESCDVDPAAIVLVRPGGVPKTSSGKVRRAATRAAFLADTLASVAVWRAASSPNADPPFADGTDPLAWLVARVAARTGVDPGRVDSAASLAASGVDSLGSAELAREIETRFGVVVSAVELLSAASLADVAGLLTPRSRDSDEPPVARDEPVECELSAGQRALWFLHALAPESSAYTVAAAFRVGDGVEEAALERAARVLVERHASLRARVVATEDGPRQRFDVSADAVLARVALDGVRGEALGRALSDLAFEPFDLAHGPLARVRIVGVDGGHALLVAAHHAVADLSSLALLVRDLGALYAAERGEGPPLAGRPPHPSEFVRWQASVVEGDAGARQLAYWRAALADAPPALDLPADRPRPATQTFRGGAVARPLDAATVARLRSLARERNVTLYTTLLAAYQAFVGRVTGARDVAVGAPASGRTASRFDGLVGYLVNAVVMRADLADDPTFDDLVVATRRRALDAAANQDYPFSALVARLGVARDASRSPLFDGMFDFHANDGAASPAGPALALEPVALERRAAQFDLSTTVVETLSGLDVEFEYNADLFDAATAERLAGAFAVFLEGAAADPSRHVSSIPLLTPVERSLALHDANAGADVGEAECVHRLVERCAALAPDAVAAYHADRELTYARLERRANALARRLRDAGVGPESRVALCLEKSFDLLVAILATLKAGGAYVPIDPTLPETRRRFVVADSGAAALVARPDAGDLGAPIALAPSADECDALVDGGATPGNLAYVIYTSGTTGAPKGVAVSHASLCGALRAWDRAYDLAALPTHLQMAGPGFDVFTGDFVRALTSGGALVLCDRDTLLDPPALAALARERRVAFAEFVPATLRELAAHLESAGERLVALRLVVVGSDAWTAADAERFRRVVGASTRVVNSYGVTEATVDSTLDDVSESSGPLTIGRPLANTAAYVLDERLEPALAGVRAELYLGGPAVARGYANRPDLTAAAFLPDPFGPPGARMYRTGDAARRLADGRIEFLGRRDTQVKVRGYRVELAEIEAALDAHPLVSASSVVVREGAAGDRLVAYVVARDTEDFDAAGLRAHLVGRLPDYMIPAAFVRLDALPLSANGKLDRRALPEPERCEDVAAGAEPDGATERALADVWARLLGVERVGRHEDFFALGGDSILVIRAVARARESGVRVAPRMLFENPTIASLARAADRARATNEETLAPADAPLLPIERWFFERDFADADRWTMDVALDAREPLDLDAVRAATNALAAHHPALRTRYEASFDGPRRVVDVRAERAIPVALVRHAASADREAAVADCARDLAARLDIERGPVVALGVVTDGARPDTLAIVAHHLVFDGISIRVVVEDFERAYRAACSGAAAYFPAPTAPVAAWAAALAKLTAVGELDAHAAHWRSLADATFVGLPFDRHVAAPTEATVSAVVVDLDAGDTSAVLRATAARGARVDEVLLAAVAAAIGRRTVAPSCFVEVEGHGRDAVADVDITRTVGWFTETHPVLIDGVDPDDLDATLGAVRRAASAAAGTSFGALRDYAADPDVRAALRRVPSPEISFNYLGRFDASDADGALLERPRAPESSARPPSAARTHAIEIDASVVDGRLSARWAYSSAEFDAETLERLAADFRAALVALSAGELARDAGVEAILPLAPAQEGMLFHHLRDAARDPYVGQVTLALSGDVDPAALALAWQSAVDTHAALRTEFVWEGVDRPVRVIRKRATLDVATHERGTLDEISESARAAGVDVGRAPLARVDLVHTGECETTVVFTHHHLLLDGWSLPIVLETVFSAYDALVVGKPVARAADAPLAPYAAWLEGRDLAAAERFFRAELAGFASPTPLPDLGVRAAGSGTAVVRSDGPESVERRARARGLTTSSVVSAAWALVLAAAAGERDVVVGATSSGRSPEVPGVESAVGMFVNTLPVRATIDHDASAIAWTRAFQARGAELRQHEGAPLALVQRCAATPTNTPLFESLLVFENYPLDLEAIARRAHFEVARVDLHEETNYPLTIVASDDGGLRFRAIYDTARLDAATVATVLDRLSSAVDRIANASEATRLADVTALAPDEAEEVLVRYNSTRREYPRDATIFEVFEGVARSRADAVALVSEAGETTYGRLLDRARRVASALRQRGVGPDSRVALAIPRSPELVVATLGVLGAGGAYVPVDPESPPARTARMLAGAGVSLVVTAAGATTPPHAEIPSVALDALGGELDDELAAASPDDLAYVMFTSGSTGEPKGIEVTNRNVLRLVRGADYADFGPDETFLHLAPPAFDASTFELWGALLNGGRLAIAPPGARSAAEIAALLDRFGVTALWLTAGLFHVVVDEELGALARVRRVLAGGDALSPAHVRRLLEAGCRHVVNGYGPTETTTFACCDVFAPGDVLGERVPIGRPVANARVYALDDAMLPVPVGAPGELYVGGDGVARGYAARPDLTASSFVPDPFGPPGSRLYRTGDLVRWRADGRLDFLGRRDGQAKVRGFRVEPAEVEAALTSLAGVRAAAVAVARPEGESARLIAYVVACDDASADAATLRAALAERLPSYMVPSRVVFLAELPLGENGKLDRRALREPDPVEPNSRASCELTAVEAAVADLWRRVLAVSEIGPDDDFFELGGHSLDATRLLAALRRAFRVDLPMAAIFEATTVAGLARALVAHEPAPGHVERAARALARLRDMSPDERRALAEAKGGGASA